MTFLRLLCLLPLIAACAPAPVTVDGPEVVVTRDVIMRGVSRGGIVTRHPMLARHTYTLNCLPDAPGPEGRAALARTHLDQTMGRIDEQVMGPNLARETHIRDANRTLASSTGCSVRQLRTEGLSGGPMEMLRFLAENDLLEAWMRGDKR